MSIQQLQLETKQMPISGVWGIAHTRWATHGAATISNAHPHRCTKGKVVIVHNGIIENYTELQEELRASGHSWTSETDSESIAHMIGEVILKGATLLEASAETAKRLKGSSAFAAMAENEPHIIVGAVIGNAGRIALTRSGKAAILSSDALALLQHSQEVTFLDDGEIAILSPDEIRLTSLKLRPIIKIPLSVGIQHEAIQKGGHPHYMAKEITEQPEALRGALSNRVDLSTGTISKNGFPFDDEEITGLKRVILLGMGSSAIVGELAARQIERLAKIPARSENAAEFRYREPVVHKGDLVIAITQSGETADTLGAIETGRKAGALTLAIVENKLSQASRMSHRTLTINAGPEIGVAATKTFTNTAASLLAFTLLLGIGKGTVNRKTESEILGMLSTLPSLMQYVLEIADVEEWAARIAGFEHLLYLGRNLQHPIAMEGALKMKELAYIHAEAYPAAEMKHGVNALISNNMPTIALAPTDRLHGKMVSNINEVKARGGTVYALVNEGEQVIPNIADSTISIPGTDEIIQPFLSLIIMQRLAYLTSIARGLNPDKPRNLAKTVTVE